jgi:hypothetical protein
MLRLSIRDVLWLTALVAMAFGWWSDHIPTDQWYEWQNKAITDLSRQLQVDGHKVEWYSRDCDGNRGIFVGIDGKRPCYRAVPPP